jgi:hypothetical protein
MPPAYLVRRHSLHTGDWVGCENVNGVPFRARFGVKESSEPWRSSCGATARRSSTSRYDALTQVGPSGALGVSASAAANHEVWAATVQAGPASLGYILIREAERHRYRSYAPIR